VEISVGTKRIRLHFEGVPVVGVPQRPSAHYGQATPSVGIIDAAVRVTLDSHDRLFFGIGGDVINQRTPLPNLDQVVSSRLTGVRYEVGYRQPVGHRQFVEALVGVVPALYGSDVYVYSLPYPNVVEAERASEVDEQLTYGLSYAHTELLFGVRGINFASHFIATGAAADRNAGFGLLAEWRALLGK